MTSIPTNKPDSGGEVIEHIKGACLWLIRAQKFCGDYAISEFYNPRERWVTQSNGIGIAGDVIASYCAMYEFFEEPIFIDKAQEAAYWALNRKINFISLPVDFSVLDIGKLIIGFVFLYRLLKEEKYLFSAIRFGEWLASCQDKFGKWRALVKPYNKDFFYTFDVKASHGLLLLWRETGINRFLRTAVKNLNWVTKHQFTNGWFEMAESIAGSDPYLIDIAYVIEGLLESGLLLGEKKYIDSAGFSAKVFLRLRMPKGTLSQKYSNLMMPSSPKSCFVGMSQMALIWLKLFKINNDSKFLLSAQKTIAYLRTKQELKTLSGGIKGGIPIEQGSRVYSALGTKYFAEASVLEYQITNQKYSLAGI